MSVLDDCQHRRQQLLSIAAAAGRCWLLCTLAFPFPLPSPLSHAPAPLPPPTHPLIRAVILFVLGFAGRGFNWAHGALFASMIASTDALAASAILKAGAARAVQGVAWRARRMLVPGACMRLRCALSHTPTCPAPLPPPHPQAAAPRSWWC